jgi:hypothetical protein
MKITTADLDSLDSVLCRAEDDWSAYYQSGYGPKDFPTRQEWRQHVRTVNADLNRVRKLARRATSEAGHDHRASFHPREGIQNQSLHSRVWNDRGDRSWPGGTL